MKNTIRWFGIIALVAVTGFSLVACGEVGNGDDSNGKSMQPNNMRLISGAIHLFFENGYPGSTGITDAAAAGDFIITIDNITQNIVTAGTGDGYGRVAAYFGISPAVFSSGTEYTVKVEYTPNSARPITFIAYDGHNKTLTAFTYEKTVVAED